ncbi:hypothetical protein ES703_15531 [subsurface metagenome]
MGTLMDELRLWMSREHNWQFICSGGQDGLKSDKYLTPQGGAVIIEYKENTGEVTHVRLVNDFACPAAKGK